MAEAADAARPSQAYREGVARGDWDDDPAQHAPLAALDRVHEAVAGTPRRGWLARTFGGGEPAPQGLYLWGGVGRGKTFMVDLFYAGLPLPVAKLDAGGSGGNGKRRTHFHRFMRAVHERLREHAGERDPLAAIVAEWRRSLRVLVLDEFFVSDIGDAMLLARVLDRMFAEGIVLVTTSNIAPSGLYADGLQRARFLPAIDLLERHCQVVEIISDTDYRLRELTRSPVYRAPLDAGSDAWLDARWHALGGDDAHREGSIELDGRRIPTRARCPGMAWFDFEALCEGPRAASDYIGIASEFHTVLLGRVPVMAATRDDAARRFVTFIDEAYDRNVKLVCTAAAAPHALYGGERLAGAFERTASRLIEMQSSDYLAQHHR
ncbi:cell division protein ZapE [Luteimonas sp. MJ250]|uniref:cell division protein ZapE n=1 Tax=Luteimonas sp. MJ250 TaxID=3129236 RepID=UPI0031BA898D